jgi:hypothetical protein
VGLFDTGWIAAAAEDDFFLDFSPVIALSDHKNLQGIFVPFSHTLATNRLTRGDVP